MDDLLEKQEVISFERLYKLWEKANWSATELDFSIDAEHWRHELDDLQRDAALWNYSLFLVGEEAVARTLTPVLDAAPGFAASIFLTTQIVDEARHHVFFDRFMREVAGLGTDTASTLGASDRYLTWGFRQVFAELDRVTGELRKKPKELPLLAQSVALYHVVIEGLLAIPGQHFIQRYLKERDILPAFRTGIDNVSRDEARHVAFGIKLLGDLIRGSKECRAAAIEMWDKVLPWSAGVFIPPNFDRRYTESFGFTLEEIYAFGMRSLETKLARMGVDPGEVGILAHEDRSLTYLERADRAWALIRAGVIGDDRREPEPDDEVMTILMDGVSRSLDGRVARSIGGIEWSFTDSSPWHLALGNGRPEIVRGPGSSPALRLETSTSEWAKIAVGRVDPRRSLLARRLKLHGSLGARAKLPRLFEQL